MHDLMVEIPGGEIELRDERTRHKWKIAIRPFLLAQYPVTLYGSGVGIFMMRKNMAPTGFFAVVDGMILLIAVGLLVVAAAT